MVKIIIEIPDSKFVEIADAFAIAYGYSNSLDVSKAEFFKKKLIEIVKDVHRNYLLNLAQVQAMANIGDVNII